MNMRKKSQPWLAQGGYRDITEIEPSKVAKKEAVYSGYLPAFKGICHSLIAAIVLSLIGISVPMDISLNVIFWIAGLSLAYSLGDHAWIPSVGHHFFRIGFKISHYFTMKKKLGWTAVALIIFCNVTPILIETMGNPWLEGLTLTNEYGNHLLKSSSAGVNPLGGATFLFLQERDNNALVNQSNGWITDYYYNGILMWSHSFSGNGSSYLIAEAEGFTNFTINLVYPDLVRQEFMICQGETTYPIHLGDETAEYDIEIQDQYRSYLKLLVIQPLYLNFWENETLEYSEDTNSDNKITEDDTTNHIFERTFYGFGEVALYIYSETISYNALYIEVDSYVLLHLHSSDDGYVTLSTVAEQIDLGDSKRFDIQLNDMFENPLSSSNSSYNAQHTLRIAICGAYSNSDQFADEESFEFLIVSYPDFDWDQDSLSSNEELVVFNEYMLRPDFPDSFAYYTIFPESNSQDLFDSEWSHANLHIEYHGLSPSYLYIDICSNQSAYMNFTLNGLPILDGELQGINIKYPYDGWYSIFTYMFLLPGESYDLEFSYATNSSAPEESIVLIANNEIIPIIEYGESKKLSDELQDYDEDGLLDSDDNSPLASWSADPRKVLRLLTEVQQDSDTEIHFQIAPPKSDLYALTHNSSGVFREWNDEAIIVATPALRLFSDVYSDISYSPVNISYDGKNLLWNTYSQEKSAYSTLKKLSMAEFIRYWQEVNTEYAQDTDGDGMPDDWENENEFDPMFSFDAEWDNDDDDLINRLEYKYGTDPYDSDSDNDGYLDKEANLVDYYDLDGDGYSEGYYVSYDPLVWEDHGTWENPTDNDDDGMPNSWELTHNLNSNDPLDAFIDLDDDGLSNQMEYMAKFMWGSSCNPNDNDTDGDGLLDGMEFIDSEKFMVDPGYNWKYWEFKSGTDPCSPTQIGTNPCDVDTNDDGRSDFIEFLDFFSILDATFNTTSLNTFNFLEFGDSTPIDCDADGIPEASPYDDKYSVEEWFQQYVNEHENSDPYFFEEDTLRHFYQQFTISRGADQIDGQIIDLSASDKSYEGSIFIPANHVSKNDLQLDLKMQLVYKIVDLNIFDKIIEEFNQTGDGNDENADRELTDVVEFDTTTQKMKLRTRHWDKVDGTWTLTNTCYKYIDFANESVWFPTFSEVDALLENQDYINSYSDWIYFAEGWDSETFVVESLIGTRFGNYNNMYELEVGTLIPPGTKIYSRGQPCLMHLYPWETDDTVTFQSIELIEHEEVNYLLYATQTNVQHDLLSTVVKNPQLWDLQSSVFDPEEGGIDVNLIYGAQKTLKSTTQLELMNKASEDFMSETNFGMGWGDKTYGFDSKQIWGAYNYGIDNRFNISLDYYSGDFNVRPHDYRERTIQFGTASQAFNGSIVYAIGHEYQNGSMGFDIDMRNGIIQIQLKDAYNTVCFELLSNMSMSNHWLINRPGQNLWDTGIEISNDNFQTITISFSTISQKVYIDIEGSYVEYEQNNYIPLFNNPNSISSIVIECTSLYAYIDQVTVPDWNQVGAAPKVLYSNSIYTTKDLVKSIVFNNYASTYRGEFFTFDSIDYYLHYSSDTCLYDLYRVGDRQFIDNFANVPLSTTTFNFNQDWMNGILPEYFSFNQEEQPETYSTAVHDDILHIHDDNIGGTTEIINYFSPFTNGSISSKIRFDSTVPTGIIYSIDVLNFSINELGELVVKPLEGTVQLGVIDGHFSYKIEDSQWFSTALNPAIDTWYEFKLTVENYTSNTEWEVILSIGEAGQTLTEYDQHQATLTLNHGDVLGSHSFYTNNNPIRIDDLCISTMREVFNEFPYPYSNQYTDIYYAQPSSVLAITDFMNNVNYSISPSIMLHDSQIGRRFDNIASGVLSFNLGVTNALGEVNVYPYSESNFLLKNINGYWHLQDPNALYNLTIPVIENEMHNWRIIYGENQLFNNIAIFYDDCFLGEFELKLDCPEGIRNILFESGDDQYVFINQISLNNALFSPCTELNNDFEFRGYWHDQLPDNFTLNTMKFEKSLYWTGEFAFENGTTFAYLDRFHVGHIVNDSWGNFDWTTEVWQGSTIVPIAKYQLENGTWVEGMRVFDLMWANTSSVNYETYFTTATIGITGARLLDLNSTDITINEYTEIADWYSEGSIGAYDATPHYCGNYNVIIGSSGLTIRIPILGQVNIYDIISEITPSSFKLNGNLITGNICLSEDYKDLPPGSIITFEIEADYIADKFLTKIVNIKESSPQYAQFAWKYGDVKTYYSFDSSQLESNISNIFSFFSSFDSKYSETLYSIEYERDYDNQLDSIVPIKYNYIHTYPTSLSIDMYLSQNSTNEELPYENTHVVVFEINTEYAIPCSFLGHISPSPDNRLDSDVIMRDSESKSEFIYYLNTTILSYYGLGNGNLWQWSENDRIWSSFDSLWHSQSIGDWIFMSGSPTPLVTINEFVQFLVNNHYLLKSTVTKSFLSEINDLFTLMNQYEILSHHQFKFMWANFYKGEKFHTNIWEELPAWSRVEGGGYMKPGDIFTTKFGKEHAGFDFMEVFVFQMQQGKFYSKNIPLFSSLRTNEDSLERNYLRKISLFMKSLKKDLDHAMSIFKTKISDMDIHIRIYNRHSQYKGYVKNPYIHHIIEPSTVLDYFVQMAYNYDILDENYRYYTFRKYFGDSEVVQGSGLPEFCRALNTFFDDTGHMIKIEEGVSKILHNIMFGQSYSLKSWDQLTESEIKIIKKKIVDYLDPKNQVFYDKLGNFDTSRYNEYFTNIKKLFEIGRITNTDSIEGLSRLEIRQNYYDWQGLSYSGNWKKISLLYIDDIDIRNAYRLVSCNPVIYNMIQHNFIDLDTPLIIPDKYTGTRMFRIREYYWFDSETKMEFLRIPILHPFDAVGTLKPNYFMIHITPDDQIIGTSSIYHAVRCVAINENGIIEQMKGYLKDNIMNLKKLSKYLEEAVENNLFPNIPHHHNTFAFEYDSKHKLISGRNTYSSTLNTLYYLREMTNDHLEIMMKLQSKLRLDDPVVPPDGKYDKGYTWYDEKIDSTEIRPNAGKKVKNQSPGQSSALKKNSKQTKLLKGSNGQVESIDEYMQKWRTMLNVKKKSIDNSLSNPRTKSYNTHDTLDTATPFHGEVGYDFGGSDSGLGGGVMAHSNVRVMMASAEGQLIQPARIQATGRAVTSKEYDFDYRKAMSYDYIRDTPQIHASQSALSGFVDDWVDESMESIRLMNAFDLNGEFPSEKIGKFFDGIPTKEGKKFLKEAEELIGQRIGLIAENNIRIEMLKKVCIDESDSLHEAIVKLTDLNEKLIKQCDDFKWKSFSTRVGIYNKLHGLRSQYFGEFIKGIIIDVFMFAFEMYTINAAEQSGALNKVEARSQYISSILFLVLDISLEAVSALTVFKTVSAVWGVIGKIAWFIEIALMAVQIGWMIHLISTVPAMGEIRNFKVDSSQRTIQRWGSYCLYDSMIISERYINWDNMPGRGHFVRLSARTSKMPLNQTSIQTPYGVFFNDDPEKWYDNNAPDVSEWHSDVRGITWFGWGESNQEDVLITIPLTELTRNEKITVHQYSGTWYYYEEVPRTQSMNVMSIGAITERNLSDFLLNIEYSASLASDTDFDGLSTSEEITHGTNGRNNDTDGDKLNDSDEINLYFTNPLNPDSDGDYLEDYEEVSIYSTNPLQEDTDDDGLLDNREITFGTSNSASDTDNDGLIDFYEYYRGSWGNLSDSDDDGLSDLTENRLNYNFRDHSDPLNVTLQTSFQSIPHGFYQGTHSFNTFGIGLDPWFTSACYGEAYINTTYSIGEDSPIHNFVYVFNQSAIRAFSPADASMSDAWAIETYVGMKDDITTFALETQISCGYYFAMRFNNVSSRFEYRYNWKDWTAWTPMINATLIQNWSIWSVAWDDDSKEITFAVDLSADELVDYSLLLTDDNCTWLTRNFIADHLSLVVFENIGTGSTALDSVSVWKEYNSLNNGYLRGDLYSLIDFPDIFWDIDEQTASISFEWAPLEGMELGMFFSDADFVDISSEVIKYMGPASVTLEISLLQEGYWYFKPVAIYQNYYFPMGDTFCIEFNAYSATFDFCNETLYESPEGVTTTGTVTVEEGKDVLSWYSSRPFGPFYRYVLINDTSSIAMGSIQKTVTHLLIDEEFIEFWIRTNNTHHESKFSIIDSNSTEKYVIAIENDYFWLKSGDFVYNTSIIARNDTWHHVRFTLSPSNYSELFIDSEFIDSFEILYWSDIHAIKFATTILDSYYTLSIRGIGISWYGYEAYENWSEMAELTFKEESIGFGSSPLPAYVSSQTKLLASGSDANFKDFVLLSETVLLTDTGKVIYFAGSEPTVTATIRPWSSAKLFEGKLYIMSEAEGHLGLSIYSITNPQNPALIGDPYQTMLYGPSFDLFKDTAHNNEIWVVLGVDMSGWELYGYWLYTYRVTDPSRIDEADYLSNPYNSQCQYFSNYDPVYNLKDIEITQVGSAVNLSVLGEFFLPFNDIEGAWHQRGTLGIRTLECEWKQRVTDVWYPVFTVGNTGYMTQNCPIIKELTPNIPGSILFNATTELYYDWQYLDYDAQMMIDDNLVYVTTCDPNSSSVDKNTAYVIDTSKEELGFDLQTVLLPYSIVPYSDLNLTIGLTDQSVVAFNATSKMSIEETAMTLGETTTTVIGGAIHEVGEYLYSMEIYEGTPSVPYHAYLMRKESGYLHDLTALESANCTNIAEDPETGNEYAEIDSDACLVQTIPYAQCGMITYSFMAEDETVADFGVHLSNLTYGYDTYVSLEHAWINTTLGNYSIRTGVWNDLTIYYSDVDISFYLNGEQIYSNASFGTAIVSKMMINTAEDSESLLLDKMHYRIFDTDTDQDTLTDQDEIYHYLTDALSCDSDFDGMPDGWEVTYELNPSDPNDKWGDLDGDLLLNVYEFGNGTNPVDKDTDNDGSEDYLELNPTNPEADPTDPLYPNDGDADGDGILNSLEQLMHSDPRQTDTDEDFLCDYDELIEWNTDPFNQDSDGDQMFDGWEVLYNLDPLDDDDAGFDPDSDKISNLGEWIGYFSPQIGAWYPHLNPKVGIDANSDGMKDDWQIFYSIANNSGSSDYDGDKLSNLAEFIGDWNGNHTWGSNPQVAYVNGTIGMSQDWAAYYEIEFSISGGAMDPDLDKVTSAQEWAGRHNNTQYSSSNPKVKSENYNMSQDWASYWDIEFSANAANLDTDLDKLRNYEEYRGKYTGFSSINWLIPRSKTTTPFQYKGVNKYWIDDWKIYWDIAGSTNITDTDGDRVLDWQEQYGIWDGDATWGLNPQNKTESYGMSKDWCAYWGIPYSDAGSYLDADSDGVKNRYEYGNNTNPRSSDTDGDTLPDKYEIKWGLNPNSDQGADGKDGNPDSDSLTNWQELRFDPVNMGMNPKSANTDGDARGDYVEWVLYWQYNGGSGLKHSDSNRVSPISSNNNPVTYQLGTPTGYTVATGSTSVSGGGFTYTNVVASNDTYYGYNYGNNIVINTTWSYDSYPGYTNATVRALLASVVISMRAMPRQGDVNQRIDNFQWQVRKSNEYSWTNTYFPGCDGQLSSSEVNKWYDVVSTLGVQYYRDNNVYVKGVGMRLSIWLWFWYTSGVRTDYIHIAYSW